MITAFGEEAEGRMSDGTHAKRRDPANPKYFQWLKRTDKTRQQLKKENKWSGLSSGKTSKEDHEMLICWQKKWCKF